MTKVTLPPLGEGVEKATVSFWYFKEGDRIEEKADLVELTTDKATFNVPAPCAGILAQIILPEGTSVNIGEVLAVIEESR